jgi:type IV pilus assembly protein PilY1
VKLPYTDPTTGMYLPGQPWEDATSGRRSVCFSAQPNAVIVVSGGSPRSDNTVPITEMMEILLNNGARHPDGSLLTFDPSNPESNTLPGGVNYCDQFVRREVYPVVEYFTKQDCDYTDYNWPTGLAMGNKNFMDDVAFFLSRTDLRGDMAGSQTVRTYVVGFHDSSPMLQSIARAGQGYFYRANNILELREALRHALNDLRSSAGSTP